MADEIDERIGRRLREMRLRADLDLDTLARRGGVEVAELKAFEAGRVRVPVDALTRLALSLGVPVSDFFA